MIRSRVSAPGRYQLPLFVAVMLVLAGVFSWQAWNLLPLYANARTRAAVQSTLVAMTDHEGWLLSDVNVTAVDADRITLTHRQHHRGADLTTCNILMLNDSSLHPCD